MIINEYSFNNFSVDKLVTCLVNKLPKPDNTIYPNDPTNNMPWHVCWIDNDGSPVIGLLPKVAWTVLPHQSYKLRKQDPLTTSMTLLTSYRDYIDKHEFKPFDYQQWIQQLIQYSDSMFSCEHTTCKNTACKDTDYQTKNASLVADNQQSLNHDNQDAINSIQYANGLMGFIGYDLSAHNIASTSSTCLHSSSQSPVKLANQPAAFIGHYDIYINLNHAKRWQLNVHENTDVTIAAKVDAELTTLDKALSSTPSNHTNALRNLCNRPVNMQPKWSLLDYKAAYYKTLEYLHSGDSYQINLTQKWQAQIKTSYANLKFNPYQCVNIVAHNQAFIHSNIHLVDYLPSLYQRTKAPFSGYLHINDNAYGHNLAGLIFGFELLSCSPELFIAFHNGEDGQHHVITKPIKGTRPRGLTKSTDNKLKDELKNSSKDRAENVMIVDLLRNDLGKYAKTGSVQVPKLFAIETFSNVHHMVSTVQATIKEDVHPLRVLLDSLPAGSITGAPKKRAVEIISELEVDARGAYCGSMGFMNFDGTGKWNVLIRTLQAQTSKTGLDINLWAGGGITVSSECDAEYKECWDKVSNLLDALSK